MQYNIRIITENYAFLSFEVISLLGYFELHNLEVKIDI